MPPTPPKTYGSLNPLLNTVSGDTPGAFQYTNGGQASMVGPVAPTVKSAPTPAPAPVAAAIPTSVVNEPTVGETLQGIQTQAQTIQDQINQMNSGGSKSYSPVSLSSNNYQNPYDKPIDEKAITRNQMKLFQAEIDATNKVYDQLYNQKVLEGTGRLGSQRAFSARRGMLGGEAYDAAQANLTNANTAEQQAVQNERIAKIGSIMGTVRKAIADDIAAKRLARTQDADAYLKYMNGRDETKQRNTQNIASAFLSQGIDPTTLTPDEMTAIVGDSGISAADIIMQYQTAKSGAEAEALKGTKTQAEIDKLNADTANAGYFNLSEGQSRYDAKGNVIASKGKTYAPGTGGGSSVSLTPEDKRTLLGGGWSESDISIIESDVRANGLTSVIENAKTNGATPQEIAALTKAYGGSEVEPQFLSGDYFKQMFTPDQLNKAALESGFGTPEDKGAGWFNLAEDATYDVDGFVGQLDQRINLYRQAGYTDKEILKMMQ